MVISRLRHAATSLRDAFSGPAPEGGVVLLYHRVASLPSDPERLAVSPRNFQAHLDLIRRHAACLPLRQLVDQARLGVPSVGRVAITFDDGYADLLHEAAPALVERGLPATMFITTGVLDPPREFWWDALARAVLGEADAGGWHVECPGDPSPRHRAYRDWRDRLRVMAPAQRDRAIDRLVTESRCGREARPAHRPLTTGEVAELAAIDGIDVGAHGVSHASMGVLADAERRAEMGEGRRTLARLVGRDVLSLAYPFGGSADATDDAVRAAADEGIDLACVATPGRVHAATDPLRVPRMIVRDWAPEAFEQRLLSWMGQ